MDFKMVQYNAISENILKTRSPKHALWHYLKRFETSEIFFKNQGLLSIHSDTIWNSFENKVQHDINSLQSCENDWQMAFNPD